VANVVDSVELADDDERSDVGFSSEFGVVELNKREFSEKSLV
jgi:hypothetical protein